MVHTSAMQLIPLTKINTVILSLYVYTSGKDFVFCWNPSHVGIPGREKADQAAKDALTEDEFRKVPVPCTDSNSILINMFLAYGNPLKSR